MPSAPHPGADAFARPAAVPLRKLAPFDPTGIALDGSFAGYASLFGVADLGNDVIAPGAFAETLARRGAGGIRLLFQHDPAEPIGIWTTLREDTRGLYAEGQLTLGNSKARDVLALLRAGAIDGLSIGFRASNVRRAGKSAPRVLTRIDLWEISVVTFPMLPGARVTSVKTRPRATVERCATPPATAFAANIHALTATIRANT